jgi:FMN reductase
MMSAQNPSTPRKLVAIHAGTSDPSSTQLLADRIADRTIAIGAESNLAVELQRIDLRGLANDITAAIVSQFVSPELQRALDVLRDADGVIASTPVYKAGPSGLFTEFFQILDNDLLIGTPIVLAGTGGSPRHSLVIDDQLRGLFAYLRTLTAPTAVYAAPEDWQESGLGSRIDRAATELMVMMRNDLKSQLRGEAWDHYQHTFGSAGGTETTIDFDSDLMRLAAGGR